ncbi:MAG: hypothetical protein ACRC2K_09700 [Clostridium sp.]
MPKQISPAYVGVLFNSSVGDIIYTITLELIRRGVIKVVKAPEYKGIKENGVYRKFTFRLTEAEVILKPFEKTFIELICDIDNINLLNLDEIQSLIKDGYFSTVIDEVEEDFRRHLSSQTKKNISFEKALTSKNLEYDKWVKFRKKVINLCVTDIKKLTVEDIERLHVLATALSIREEEFSLFSLVNPNSLLISKYFTSLVEKFDNGKYVLNYLEEKFI